MRPKQNITMAIDKRLLKRARALAAKRGASVSAMLAGERQRMVERETAYELAKAKALAQLDSPFHLGGAGITDREALHDRQAHRPNFTAETPRRGEFRVEKEQSEPGRRASR